MGIKLKIIKIKQNGDASSKRFRLIPSFSFGFFHSFFQAQNCKIVCKLKRSPSFKITIKEGENEGIIKHTWGFSSIVGSEGKRGKNIQKRKKQILTFAENTNSFAKIKQCSA